MTVADEAIALMEVRGGEAYLGEAVSQREHALQAAASAAQAGSSPQLIVAALLHDVGHLLPDSPHEEAGYRWLLSRFGPEVADPALLHVAAKRYLCSTEPDYFARLSPASVESLALQGGPFSDEEAREFEKLPHSREAVMLRRWDDAAKTPGAAVPDLETYRTEIDAVALTKL